MAFQTTGIGTAAQVGVDATTVSLSLSGTNTHQITASVQDAFGHILSQITLSAAASASGGSTVYTGTVTNGGSNAFAGFTFVVAGFVTNTVNNGTFVCTASTTTTLTLSNNAGVAETHAATATPQGFSSSTTFTYSTDGASAGVSSGSQLPVASVSGSGLITGLHEGGTVVFVTYPTFSNTDGNDKIYKEINVSVVL